MSCLWRSERKAAADNQCMGGTGRRVSVALSWLVGGGWVAEEMKKFVKPSVTVGQVSKVNSWDLTVDRNLRRSKELGSAFSKGGIVMKHIVDENTTKNHLNARLVYRQTRRYRQNYTSLRFLKIDNLRSNTWRIYRRPLNPFTSETLGVLSRFLRVVPLTTRIPPRVSAGKYLTGILSVRFLLYDSRVSCWIPPEILTKIIQNLFKNFPVILRNYLLKVSHGMFARFLQEFFLESSTAIFCLDFLA